MNHTLHEDAGRQDDIHGDEEYQKERDIYEERARRQGQERPEWNVHYEKITYIMKKYNGCNYQILLRKEGYSYEIWAYSFCNGFSAVRESSEWYESEEEAHEAAHAHIDKLESGEGQHGNIQRI